MRRLLLDVAETIVFFAALIALLAAGSELIEQFAAWLQQP